MRLSTCSLWCIVLLIKGIHTLEIGIDNTAHEPVKSFPNAPRPIESSKLKTPNFQSFEEWKKEKKVEEDTSVLGSSTCDSYKLIKSEKLNEEMLKKLSRPEFNQRNKVRKSSDDDSLVASDGMQFDVFSEEKDSVELEVEAEVGAEMAEQEEQGKTYKERFNFASFDCAATIIKTNKEAKSANAVLVDSKDTYLLNECNAPSKFVIIELCEDILIDEVLIGNYEFYSSMFRNIRISASDRYPASQWYTLGEFEAENIRQLQRFKIENSLIWAKFLKIEILSYYGKEFYCPISSIQAHGKTMIEQFKEDLPAVNEEAIKNVETKTEENKSEFSVGKKPEFNVQLSKSFISCFDLNSSLVEQKDCSTRYLKLEQFLNNYEGNVSDREQCDVDEPMANSSNSQSLPKIQPQDSIYKNIVKRLNSLESNATLSLHYIEEQSKLLSDAFTRLESQQSMKFQTILKQLNSTIQSQMDVFQKLNVDVYTSFARLFEYQQSSFDKNSIELSKQVSDISDAIGFYKNLTYFCLFTILLLFFYILLTKDLYIDETYFTELINETENTISRRHSVSPLLSKSEVFNSEGEDAEFLNLERPNIIGHRSKSLSSFTKAFRKHKQNTLNDETVGLVALRHRSKFIDNLNWGRKHVGGRVSRDASPSSSIVSFVKKNEDYSSDEELDAPVITGISVAINEDEKLTNKINEGSRANEEDGDTIIEYE